MDRAAFYDSSRIAIVPAGLCYPGTVSGADLPPRPECARRGSEVPRALPGLRLTLLVGRYAQAYYLGSAEGNPWRKRCAPTGLPARILPAAASELAQQLWLKRNPGSSGASSRRSGKALMPASDYNPRPS